MSKQDTFKESLARMDKAIDKINKLNKLIKRLENPKSK